MKKASCALLSFSLLLAMGGCSAQSQDPKSTEQQPDPQPSIVETADYEETTWNVVSIRSEDYGITPEMRSGADMPDFTKLSLSALCAYYLDVDSAGAEIAAEELYQRFLSAPNTVLNYMALIGDQTIRTGTEPAAVFLCRSIATTDVNVYGQSERFYDILEKYKGYYPSGRVAKLLETLENAYNAAEYKP